MVVWWKWCGYAEGKGGRAKTNSISSGCGGGGSGEDTLKERVEGEQNSISSGDGGEDILKERVEGGEQKTTTTKHTQEQQQQQKTRSMTWKQRELISG